MPSAKKTKRKASAFKQQKINKSGPAENKSTPTPAGKPSQTALIIAIDFGTTFSGVAWHNIASKKTHHIRDWPEQSQSSDKVPTVLRYNSKGTCKWGHVRGTNRLEWFKLLLNEGDYTTSADLLHRLETKGLKGYPEDISTNLANLRTTIKAIPEGKRPADLAVDYLRLLYKYVRERLEDNFSELKDQLGSEGEVEIKCCLTVPAIWDDTAKEITRQAAIAAGMPEKQIYMISEPEAAAVHCLTDLDETKGNLKVGDVYVIADCGGGTVDLIPYEVTSIAPGLRVRECTVGTGGLYGSTLLNRRFEGLVIRRIGQEAYDQMDDYDREVMRKDFETEIKPKFNPDNDDDDDDGLTCELPGVPDDVEKRVQRRKIRFSTNELREIFEPVFTDIANLVQNQVNAAQEATNKNVDRIILVGGFASSRYLVNWLKVNVRNKDGKAIELIRPVYPAAAIALGALEHGVRMHLAGTTSQWGIVDSRKARYNYGITTAEPFRPDIHPHRNGMMDPFSGIPMCIGRMKWLILKGENMRQGVGISYDFYRRCPIVNSKQAQKGLLVFEEEVYASAEDIAPEDQDHPSVCRLLTYQTNLNDVPRRYFTRMRGMLGFEYWMIPANILLKLESADLAFTTLVGGTVYGEGKKLYHHDEPTGLRYLRAPAPRARLEGIRLRWEYLAWISLVCFVIYLMYRWVY